MTQKVRSRQHRIFDRLIEKGTQTPKALAEHFAVSLNTIHRDLDELERRDKIRKLHGSVTAQPSPVFEPGVDYWLHQSPDEKRTLAQFATTLVESGQSIMLDSSAINLSIARALTKKTPITVMTNFKMAIDELASADDVMLYALGGEYSKKYGNYTGILCEQAIRSVNVDTLFMSTSAVSKSGLYHPSQDAVRIKQAMMAVASTKILVLEHEALEARATHHITGVDKFDLVIVSDQTPETVLEIIDSANVAMKIIPT